MGVICCQAKNDGFSRGAGKNGKNDEDDGADSVSLTTSGYTAMNVNDSMHLEYA